MDLALPIHVRHEAKRLTWEAHKELHQHPFHRHLLSRKFDFPVQVFRDQLRHQEFYLGCIESALKDRKVDVFDADPAMSELYHFFERVFRADRCASSGAYLDEAHHTVRQEEVPAELVAFGARIQQLRDEDPKLLFVHAWINLVDGLFGGPSIAQSVERRWGEPAGAYLRYSDDVLDRTWNAPKSMKRAKKLIAEEFSGPFETVWRNEDLETMLPKIVAEANASFHVVRDSLNSLDYPLGPEA